MTSPLSLLASGFLLGWSVAWPPGPINAEVTRRTLAAGFWAGFALILGACSGDAVWALSVALGVGVLFTGPAAQMVLGVLSLGLLAHLALTFTRRAWAAFQGGAGEGEVRFDTSRASYLLGLTLALTSPWNVTFWIAAMGRPGMAELGLQGLLILVLAVVAGALAWGMIWSGVVVLFREKAREGKWAAVLMNGATALLMVWFGVEAAVRLFG